MRQRAPKHFSNHRVVRGPHQRGFQLLEQSFVKPFQRLLAGASFSRASIPLDGILAIPVA